LDLRLDFSDVVYLVIQFCYLMTVPSFDLDPFLNDIDFGARPSRVLLYAVLIYLDESRLLARMRKSLAVLGRPDRALFAVIDNLFTLSTGDPVFAQEAVERARRSVSRLSQLSGWSKFTNPPRFVSPFDWVPYSIRYHDVADFRLFLLQCKRLGDWPEVSSFPPGPECFHVKCSVKRFVVLPWYRSLYDQLITDTEGFPPRTILMGSAGIGKSVFGLYLVARLISSTRGILDKQTILMSWQRPWGERCWLRVHFNGEVEEIEKKEFFRDAEDETFAIFDDLAFNQESPIPYYLSIVAPSECVRLPAVDMMRYARPIKRQDLNLLTDVSKRYPLRDDGTQRESHGSIETRMTIAGGNLRLLFSAFSLRDMQGLFEDVASKLKFTQIPKLYFNGATSDDAKLRHFAFGAFPEEPLEGPGEVYFVSDFAKDLLMTAGEKLRKSKECRGEV
jgi:hypothetical protein